MNTHSKRIALVTGANKGIGYETARQLGALGYRVWLGARDGARGEASAQALRDLGHDVRFVQIAVEDDASVQAAAQSIADTDDRLDLLINNAGIPGNYADPLAQGLDDIRSVYETNLFGPIRVIYACLPLLKAGKNASIVNVSTGLASLAWLSDPQNPYYGVNLLGYNSSKTALNAATVSFAKALSPFGIRVNCVSPGYTKTDFTNHAGYRSAEEAAASVVHIATHDDADMTGGFFHEDGTRLPW